MSLTVVTNPADFQLSKNNIPFELSTNVQYTEGTNAYFIFRLRGNGSNGQTVEFTFGSTIITFTLVDNPASYGDAGTYLPHNSTGAFTQEEFRNELIKYFKINRFLDDNFYIFQGALATAYTPAQETIIFLHKVKTPDFLLTGFSATGSGYILALAVQAGYVSDSFTTNYKAKAEIYIQQDYTSTLPSYPNFLAGGLNGDGTIKDVDAQFILAGTVEADAFYNKILFDISEIVDAHLEYDIPAYGLMFPSLGSKSLQGVYLKYNERYGTPVAEGTVKRSTTFLVLKAGIKPELFSATSNTISQQYLTGSVNFLTRQPRTKKVAERQKEYLSFLYYKKNGSYNFDIKLKLSIYVPGKAVFIQIGSAITRDTNRDLSHITIPVGYCQLGIDIHPDAGKITHYTIEIIRADTEAVISETFTYIPDFAPTLDTTYLYFANSDSGFDTIRCTGSVEHGLMVEKETAQTIRQYNTAIASGEINDFNLQKTVKKTINTGWLTKAQADWVEGLFTSEKKLIDNGSAFLPVNIANSDIKKYTSTDGKTAYEIETEYSIPSTVS